MSSRLLLLMRRRGGGYALDGLSTNLAIAYSLRRLLTSYTGNAIRVREDSGNTEADIGFDSDGNLDTTALLAHTGANSGYVTTWYDQVGSLNQTTAVGGEQPRIVNSGTVDVDANGNPQIVFDGSNDRLQASPTTQANVHLFAACNPDAVNRRALISGILDGSGIIINSEWVSGIATVAGNATVATYSASHMLLSVQRTGSSNYIFAVNGTESSGGSDGGYRAGDYLVIGATQNGLSLFWDGGVQEILAYSAAQTRSTIEAAINSYWTIY